MLSISSISALGLVVGQVVSAQFVPAPTDLIATIGYLDIPVRYKEVPTGICELDPSVKRYAMLDFPTQMSFRQDTRIQKS